MCARIFAVVPAYNEADAIAQTIASLHQQTRQPDLIVVVPNNCTDDTASVAAAAGAYVIDLPGHNPDKKAGAINYALNRLEPYLDARDSAVLIMDADTTLAPDFLDIAERCLSDGHGAVGGVGGTFVGRPCSSLLGELQRMEFHRYGQTSRRYADRAFVLTGTGTLFLWSALLEVRTQRRAGVRLPSGNSFYDTHSLTEDNELTFALQTLGYTTLSPDGMHATTDVMESVGKLILQRERWYLGALRNIWHYGRRMPWHMRWVYWRQQAGLLLSALTLFAYVSALTVTIALTGGITFSWWWTLPSVLFIVERTVSVWHMSGRARLLAVFFIPEQLYTIILTCAYARAFLIFIRGGKGNWVAT